MSVNTNNMLSSVFILVLRMADDPKAFMIGATVVPSPSLNPYEALGIEVAPQM